MLKIRYGAVSELRGKAWPDEARRRAFWRTSDRLRTDAGDPYAMAHDADGWPIIPAHRREHDSPEMLAALNPGLMGDPAMASLLRSGRDLEETVNARRRLCRPVAYVRKIADHYASHVMRHPSAATGENVDRWQEWAMDVDGLGTSLHDLMRQALRAGLVEACAGVLADWTGAAPESMADLGPDRVVARLIRADQIVAVERTTMGACAAAIILLRDPEGAPFLWYVDSQATQRARLDKDAAQVIAIEPANEHGFGRCPLFLMDALPAIIPGVAEGQKAIAQTDSLLRHRCHEDAIPWQVITGSQNGAAIKAALLRMPLVTVIEDPAAKAQILGPDVNVAESLRKTIQQDEDQLYEDAKIRPVAAQGAPESGVAQAYRFVDADVELAACAEQVERAEQHLAECVASQLAWGDAPTITRTRSFVPQDRDAILRRGILASASTLPPALVWRELRAVASALYPGDDSLAEDLRMAEADALARRPEV